MLLDVSKVVLLWKLDARRSLERSRAQVMQKRSKMIPNGRPGVPLGALWSSENDINMQKKCYFVIIFPVSIVDGSLGQIFSEIASEGHGLNRVWTAQARADRIWAVVGKSSIRDSLFDDFDVVSGARRSHSGDFFPKKR